MDALIAREMALGGADPFAPALKKKPKAAPPAAKGAAAAATGSGALGGSAKGNKAQRKEKLSVARGASSGGGAGSSVYNADVDEDGEVEEDEDFQANGYLVPDALSAPSADQIEADVGRRVYLEGVPGKDAFAGELVVWHRNKSMWEVELDRGDEHILVRPANLRWLDLPPPSRAKKPKPKSPTAASTAAAKKKPAAAASAAKPQGIGKKQKLKKSRQ